VSLPIFTGPGDLPVGCQLVGAPGEDARLMAAARSLLDAVQAG
jgi:Asp-tRNA(Asn)/Glu-tRNA(Gln) amidotransferase A subunit family amidase